MIIGRRFFALATLAAALVVGGCSDGLIRPAAPAGPAHVALAASFSVTSGGVSEAYQKVDALSIRFRVGSTERLAQVVPFDPTATQTEIELQVPLEDATETFDIELELRDGQLVLFRGSGSAVLSAGGTNDVNIPIVPVVSGVICAGPPFQVAVYGAPRGPLFGFGLFASGDTVPSVPITWSTSDATIVTVSPTGQVTGLRDGSASVGCSAQGFTASRAVQVFGVVASILVQPAQDTAAVGTSVTFTAAHRDSLGNAITGPRATTWSTDDARIAVVGSTGQATAVAPGVVRIRATSGAGTGFALLTVVFPPPIVTTVAASNVGATTATLTGAVNPRGANDAQAWFEYGTASNLTGATATARQNLAANSTTQTVSQAVANLVANQTYYFRAVSSNGGGTVSGTILSFITRSAPVVRTIGGTPVGNGAQLVGGVNPQGLATEAWFEWSTSPLLANSQQTVRQNLTAGNRVELPTSASLANLAAGTLYYFRAVASNSVGTAFGEIMSLRANGPPVTTTLPAVLAPTSATLPGTVNPNGTATTVWFEWASNPLMNGATQVPAQNLPAGTTDVSVSAALSELTPGATYFFRVAAQNAVATSRGAILSFIAPSAPGAATLAPTGITNVTAILQGLVDPNGAATDAWFEIGLGPAPNTFTSSPAQPVGDGTSSVAYARTVTGLQQATTYTFRLAASNALGTTRGTPVTFTTAGPPVVFGTGSSWDYSEFAGYWITTFYGAVTPNGAASEAWFQVATDTAFANVIATSSRIGVPAGFSEVPYNRVINGLPGCGPFYYRAVASNAYGTTYGALRSTYCEGEFVGYAPDHGGRP